MAIENVELMHECFPQQLCMGIARLKEGNDTEEECKNREGEYMERSTEGTKKKSRRSSYISGRPSSRGRYSPMQ